MPDHPQHLWGTATPFINLGPGYGRVLYRMMRSRTDEQAQFAVGIIFLIREHKDLWDFRRDLAGDLKLILA